MRLRDTLDKALAYLGPWDSYWPKDPAPTNPEGVFEPYPLDIRRRLAGDHYGSFDSDGLPRRQTASGFVYNSSTVTSYATACFDRDGCRKETPGAALILSAAEWVIREAKGTLEEGLIIEGYTSKKGLMPSAMYQGGAMSLLSRAWTLSKDDRYKAAALAFLPPLDKLVEEGGLTGIVSATGKRFFEEDPIPPLCHILNGNVYALWGLRDASATFGSQDAKRLWEEGVESLCLALPYFDAGFWSWYHIPEPGAKPYLASMMYHNLHIVQLGQLFHQTGRPEFKASADKFRAYAQSPVCRLKAASGFLRQKR